MKNPAILNCRKCSLHANQKPLLDHERKADVMWIGLSAKRVASVQTDIPLQSDTRTGKLIADIEVRCPNAEFYKTNLVKCLPLNKEGKLRYPSARECALCYPHLLTELQNVQPKVVLLLGAKVASLVLDKIGHAMPTLSYAYDPIHHGGRWYVFIHHPSYISVYKQKEKGKYVKSVKKIIDTLIDGA